MDTITKIELLAPARNLVCGRSAIDNGADAVYIAGSRFGAREAAGNSMADIEQLAAYAHKYYAKIYLTLNTILYEDELEAAGQLARDAWNVGCDALIIQDMGLLEMDLPPIPLFASTQTNNTTPEKVKFLQDVGFERVILARELSLQQIAAIRKATTVALESFIHGALCVCYSGQCYLSQALTGRSANRGACAQPCRALYDLIDGTGQALMRNKHLLSLRDLNRTGHLEALLEAGVTSFKIEGRLKNESYVKNIVAHYRRQIDRVLEGKPMQKSSSGHINLHFTPDTERSFSRGFTDYFVKGRKDDIASFDTGKAIGQRVGRAVEVHNNRFTYEGIPLHNADGICFFDPQGKLHGTNVNRVEQHSVFVQNSSGLTVGAAIFRNLDFAFEKELQQKTRRRIRANITFHSHKEAVVITATDEDQVCVRLSLPPCGMPAVNEETALRTIKTQLEKSGALAFNFTVTAIHCAPVRFFPAAQLNGWRRALAQLLEQQREVQRVRLSASILPNQAPYPETTVDYRANVANSFAQKFYERHGAAVSGKAFEQSVPEKPVLMCTKYCIKQAIGACQKYGGSQTVVEPLYLRNNGKWLRLSFDCANCQMLIRST